jgi:enterochelin esterase-like enzyme
LGARVTDGYGRRRPGDPPSAPAAGTGRRGGRLSRDADARSGGDGIDTATQARSSAVPDPERLAEAARRRGTPLIDATGATFVHLGSAPPTLVGEWSDFRPEDALPHHELAPGVWVAHRDLPVSAYVEYAYLLEGHREPDPLNRWPAPDGIGGRISRLWMPQAPQEALRFGAAPASDVARGRLTRHRFETGRLVAGRTRRVVLYVPADIPPAACQLLVVLDGQDYLRRQRLHRVVDALVAARRISPLVIAFVDHGGDARFPEYACSDATVAFLADRVVPFARSVLGLGDGQVRARDGRGRVGIVGPSLGGLMALYAGLRRPDVFGRVLSQSGTFELPSREMVTGDLVRHLPSRPVTVRLSAGTFEWLAGPVARMAELLRARGYDITHRPFVGGHNHRVWAEDALLGLEAMFPPASLGDGAGEDGG